ncbi:MAG: lactonase family protein [Chloroflexi bacterium]|jgi:6-phosphogluconolactonase|nr:lactonase family protein [Chloroflexota bacterium]
MTQTTEFLVYVGTYTRGPEEGIYVYTFDAATGALQYQSVAAGVVNPSFLAIHPSQRFLYATNELGGESGGAVSAFAIDPASGNLTFINSQPAKGTATCYVSTDRTGQYAMAANYGSGSIIMFPIQPDGSLKPDSSFIQHEGASRANPARQESPHAHSIMPDPNNRYVLACDLGLDKVMVYNLDLPNGLLTPAPHPWAQVTPGMGPRHFAFHPQGQYVYVVTEMGSTIIAYAYDAEQGKLDELQTLSTLPEGYQGDTTGADIQMHPSGKFVYTSNRGHDSIAMFAIDESTGLLTSIGYESTQGRVPRNFAIDPTGTFLLAANQNSDTVVSFHLDPVTGKLTPTGHVTEIPRPVCVKMMARG